MLIIRVELHSAITGSVTELARMDICNVTGGGRQRSYKVRTFRGRCAAVLDRRVAQRRGEVTNWPAQALHVWNLVAEALRRMGYGRRAVALVPVPPAKGRVDAAERVLARLGEWPTGADLLALLAAEGLAVLEAAPLRAFLEDERTSLLDGNTVGASGRREDLHLEGPAAEMLPPILAQLDAWLAELGVASSAASSMETTDE